jgi:hypothetical protein
LPTLPTFAVPYLPFSMSFNYRPPFVASSITILPLATSTWSLGELQSIRAE